MFSYLSQAAGNLFAGSYIVLGVSKFGGEKEDYYSHIVLLYAIFGFIKAIAYCSLSSDI